MTVRVLSKWLSQFSGIMLQMFAFLVGHTREKEGTEVAHRKTDLRDRG